ncbi:septum formation protein [Pseudidiomarina planktonica]|uniref:dTTP/UTP pyrophosphatase n=1 Tax=Pseudidiomarina planktonica TaxID=1323738 RepID=A0A1Y6EGW6_9GAMM|nr:Maf family protein [Pseudidiomarina planktonica]RUO66109.1 septum formation inhibitor Maf [Pseudidiomarina planktonica]SMQ60391.1 septum formation protein [Pseudidiomarina planktonica]
MKSLVLASGSPRRADLLTQLGYQFSIVKPNIIEQQQPSESAPAYVERLAREKAEAGLQLLSAPAVVIGSDTLLVLNNQVLEKPRDKAHFMSMFQALSGATHEVLTAVAVTNGEQTRTIRVSTKVSFKVVTTAEMEAYWHTGEPADKAGGYGIQGIGGRFVTTINGSYFAVVGLPLYETEQLLTSFGLVSAFGSTV